jgi:sugar phosphate isomerase/epimerase
VRAPWAGSVWAKLYFFPPTSQKDIDTGYEDFADRWTPILDEFKKQGVAYALEVHPTEIAYDIIAAHRAMDAVKSHPAFGFNFDPSHFIHQFINPVAFIEGRIRDCSSRGATESLVRTWILETRDGAGTSCLSATAT